MGPEAKIPIDRKGGEVGFLWQKWQNSCQKFSQPGKVSPRRVKQRGQCRVHITSHRGEGRVGLEAVNIEQKFKGRKHTRFLIRLGVETKQRGVAARERGVSHDRWSINIFGS